MKDMAKLTKKNVSITLKNPMAFRGRCSQDTVFDV